MNNLFDKKDILTSLTTDKAKIGDKGYFGDTLKDIETSVEYGEVYPLVWIDRKNLSVYPFKNNFFEDRFALFLPADKVKKEPTYRPFNSLNELFNFFFPEFIKDNFCDQTEKALFFLGKTLVLKNKYNEYTKVMTIKEVDFFNDCSSDGGSDNIELNCFSLLYLFNNFEIKKDGKFVPFGILEE